jgi:hypothetical protein
MAKEDLVLQKMVRVTPSTHAALVRFAAEIQTKTSTNTSMDDAIKFLLYTYEERRVKVASAESYKINETE